MSEYLPDTGESGGGNVEKLRLELLVRASNLFMVAIGIDDRSQHSGARPLEHAITQPEPGDVVPVEALRIVKTPPAVTESPTGANIERLTLYAPATEVETTYFQLNNLFMTLTYRDNPNREDRYVLNWHGLARYRTADELVSQPDPDHNGVAWTTKERASEQAVMSSEEEAMLLMQFTHWIETFQLRLLPVDSGRILPS